MAIKFHPDEKLYTGLSTDNRTATTYDNNAKLYLTDTCETLVYANGSWVVKTKEDRVTKGYRILTTDHSSIHAKEGFSISGIFTSVNNAATVNYAFKTPAIASGKYIHLKYHDFGATANKVRVDLYEKPTNDPAGGTDLTAYNHNRVAATPTATNMQAIKTGMTIDTTGASLIETAQFIPTNSRSLDIEYVLKPNTWYVRTFTNGTGNTVDINFYEFWYEEDFGENT